MANGYYATVLEEDGECWLYLKTVERAHTPRTMWEKVKLSEDTSKAFEQIDKKMLNIYKDYEIIRCKRRLGKIREYLRRMKAMAVKPTKQYDYEAIKVRRRETARERLALRAAKLQSTVEQELINRLKSGHYQDIYNYSPAFQNVLDQDEEQQVHELDSASEQEDDAESEGPELERDIEELA